MKISYLNDVLNFDLELKKQNKTKEIVNKPKKK